MKFLTIFVTSVQAYAFVFSQDNSLPCSNYERRKKLAIRLTHTERDWILLKHRGSRAIYSNAISVLQDSSFTHSIPSSLDEH